MVIGTGTRRRAHIGPRIYFRNPLAITAVLLIVGLFFAVLAGVVWQQQARFAANGVTIQAQVVDKDTGTRVVRNRVQRYHNVSYEFTLEGQTIRSESSIDGALYEQLHLGDSLDVIYLPDNPGQNIPAANQGMLMASILVGAAALWNGAALLYLGKTWVLPFLLTRRAA
jgi:hypothetical protein